MLSLHITKSSQVVTEAELKCSYIFYTTVHIFLLFSENTKLTLLFFYGVTTPSGLEPPHYRGFAITLRHATFCRTPLEEWLARLIDLYLRAHNTHKRQTSVRWAGFEPTIPASERSHSHAATLNPTIWTPVRELWRPSSHSVTDHISKQTKTRVAYSAT